MKEISIIIGFKDWGPDRILGAVRSLVAATKNVDAEIIVSDYGSEEPLACREEIESLGAKYAYFETDGVWSRSRALNAGLQLATGKILATTDADMVFSPNTFRILTDFMNADPGRYTLMQCRDLPEGINHEMIQSGKITFESLEQRSVFRPRWGMGGLIAISRDAYMSTRGLDERMKIYGGEDVDFAKRVRRLGLRQTWLDHPEARMYHVWHPSSRVAADSTQEGRAAIALNRDIHLNDRSIARNVKSWMYPPAINPPLISVVISTFNRAKYLSDSISSVLAQSFEDFELILINDGSSDNTREIVSSFTDARIRYYEQENRGLAAARNRATALARGKYIAVHDDDDIMLPDRLYNSLNAIEEGFNGSYGGWVDFIHETGKRDFHTGKNLSLESLLFNNGACLHPTLLIEKRIMSAIPYDETLRSGSDYNLAIRMQRAGVKFRHSGNYHILRRLHEDQITQTDSEIQKASGALSSFFARSTMLWSDVKKARESRAEKDKVAITAQKEIEPQIIRYLPDEVVSRKALIEIVPGAEPRPATKKLLKEATGFTLRDVSNNFSSGSLRINGLKLQDLFTLMSDGAVDVQVEALPLTVESRLQCGEQIRLDESQANNFNLVMRRIVDRYTDKNQNSYAIVLQSPNRSSIDTIFRDSWKFFNKIELILTQDGKEPDSVVVVTFGRDELIHIINDGSLDNAFDNEVKVQMFPISELSNS